MVKSKPSCKFPNLQYIVEPFCRSKIMSAVLATFMSVRGNKFVRDKNFAENMNI